MDANASAYNDTSQSYATGVIPVSTMDPADAVAQDYSYITYNLTELYGPKRDPLYVVIPITFIYMIIFISGVVGNISTCIVISKNRSMHTATNYYLFSLAVSDFLLLLSGVPMEMYSIWSKYPYVFGEVFCVLRGLAAEASANATVLTITAFTVERYVAICHPFLSHTMSKLSRAVRLILLVWIISIGLAIPQALQFGVTSEGGLDQCGVKRIIIEHSFELSTFLFFMAPMSLITVLYVLIGLKLRTSSLMPRTNGVTLTRRPHTSSCRQQQASQGTRRVLKMLVAVVVAFFLCWAPFHAQRLVAIYGSGNDHLTIYVIMTYISGILYYLSTCINPLLYNIMSNKFREAFKETLAKCCRSKERRYDKKRAYRVLSRSQRKRIGINDSTDYSGSSVRDESLYSTSTQKQSFDSVTLPRVHSLSINHAKTAHYDTASSHKVARDSISMTTTSRSNSQAANRTTATSNLQGTDNADESLYNNYNALRSVETHLNGASDDLMERAITIDSTPDEGMNVMYTRMGEIAFVNRNVKKRSGSRLVKFFENVFSWRQESRNIGYYSPPLGNNDVVNVAGPRIDANYGFDEQLDATSLDDGAISNSSLKDVDKYALEDELSAYMAELRKREKR